MALDQFHCISHIYFENLLERDIRALIFVGKNDAACNRVSVSNRPNDMDWIGQSGYATAPEEDWVYEGEVAGMNKTYGPLNFLIVKGAGRIVDLSCLMIQLKVISFRVERKSMAQWKFEVWMSVLNGTYGQHTK